MSQAAAEKHDHDGKGHDEKDEKERRENPALRAVENGQKVIHKAATEAADTDDHDEKHEKHEKEKADHGSPTAQEEKAHGSPSDVTKTHSADSKSEAKKGVIRTIWEKTKNFFRWLKNTLT